jgi:hypothetical protein
MKALKTFLNGSVYSLLLLPQPGYGADIWGCGDSAPLFPTKTFIALTCENDLEGCTGYKDFDGKHYLVKEKEQLPIQVIGVTARYRSPMSVVDITYDKITKCRVEKFSATHLNKFAALIFDKQVLLNAYIPAPITTDELGITLGLQSTYHDVVDLCKKISPSCRAEESTWISIKEFLSKKWNKMVLGKWEAARCKYLGGPPPKVY